MIKSKKMILFLKKKVCDKDEKSAYRLTKRFMRNFIRTKNSRQWKKKSLKFLELYIMNLKIH